MVVPGSAAVGEAPPTIKTLPLSDVVFRSGSKMEVP
jgi:hypothetical protein